MGKLFTTPVCIAMKLHIIGYFLYFYLVNGVFSKDNPLKDLPLYKQGRIIGVVRASGTLLGPPKHVHGRALLIGYKLSASVPGLFEARKLWQLVELGREGKTDLLQQRFYGKNIEIRGEFFQLYNSEVYVGYIFNVLDWKVLKSKKRGVWKVSGGKRVM